MVLTPANLATSTMRAGLAILCRHFSSELGPGEALRSLVERVVPGDRLADGWPVLRTRGEGQDCRGCWPRSYVTIAIVTGLGHWPAIAFTTNID